MCCRCVVVRVVGVAWLLFCDCVVVVFDAVVG